MKPMLRVHSALLLMAAVFAGRALLSITGAAERPYLLRDLRPYTADADTALLLHLDGSLDGATGALYSEGLRWSDSGLFGRALRCDGKQQISIPFQADLANGFTAECWVWLDRPLEETERYNILSCRGAFDLFVDASRDRVSRVLAVVQTDQDSYTFRSWIPVCYRRWMHVAVVYDPPARHRLLVLINGSPAHNWRRYEGLPEVHGRLRAGKGELEFAEGFRGSIDEVRVSTRARTSCEIEARWPSGRMEDHEPFEPDVVYRRGMDLAGSRSCETSVSPGIPNSHESGYGKSQRPSYHHAAPPHGWNPAALWLEAAQAVPTFNSIGLYVRYRGDVNANGKCRVRFRQQGREAWRQGMDLEPCRVDGEFRGSLLSLEPDTSYEIELSTADPDGRAADNVYPAEPEDLVPPLRLVKRTWKEDVPIAEVCRLPPGESKGPLHIDAKGSPDGWIVYTPPEGGTSVVSVAGTQEAEAIRFDGAAYVTLDRVVVRGGTRCGINIVDSRHIRIRRSEISHFGEAGELGDDGRYVDEDGALISGRSGVRVGLQSRQVVVEDCLIHSPLVTARTWKFGHPAGPLGVYMGMAFSPNHVVRNNEVLGSEEYWWLDGVGGGGDGFICGQPYRDTDISGNSILCSQDDGTELDGGQINVRFWGNRVTSSWAGISVCPNIKGPSYVFRNLFIGGDGDGRGGHPFKFAALHLDYGRSMCVNNTHMSTNTRGPEEGVHTRVPWTHGQIHTTTALNTLSVLRDPYVEASGQGDGAEKDSETDVPQFVAPKKGDYRLAEGSMGIDAGKVVPNVTDGFHGKAPDLGALETSPDEHGIIPHRPSGMQVRPQQVMIRHTLGDNAPAEQKGPSQKSEVVVTIPESAGTTWRAIPVGRWLRATPATGTTSGRSQTVVVDCIGDGLGAQQHRGAIVFRTDEGLNLTLLVHAMFSETP